MVFLLPQQIYQLWLQKQKHTVLFYLKPQTSEIYFRVIIAALEKLFHLFLKPLGPEQHPVSLLRELTNPPFRFIILLYVYFARRFLAGILKEKGLGVL